MKQIFNQRFRIIGLACSLAVTFLSSSSLLASSPEQGRKGRHSWPTFRGPLGNGVSTETEIVDSWPESGPPLVWRSQFGNGFSGIAIDGDRAFTMEQRGGEQRLVAFEPWSGTLLWSTTTGPAFDSSYGGGPRATPVVSKELVYGVDANGFLGAMEVDSGHMRWAYDLTKSFSARVPAIGFASTPAIDGDRLLVETGAVDGTFIALDRNSGELLWSSQSDSAAYATPIVFEALGERQAVFFSGSGLSSLAPADGRLLWHAPWSSPCPATGIPLNAASPVFVPPDRIFASSAWGDRKGGALYQLVPSDAGMTITEVWHNPVTIDGEISTPVLVDTSLYGFKGSILLAVDSTTGKTLWNARGFGRGSVIAVDGKLIVLGEHGTLALIAADPGRYRELATYQLLDGRSWTAPSLANGLLLARNESEIVAVDLGSD